MKIMVIGSGGREHAIAWKLAQSDQVQEILCAPGNGGTAGERKCRNLPVSGSEELLQVALEHQVDLTVVGPEQPLVEGIADLFRAEGLAVVGPEQAAARLEGSKAFAKSFMQKYGIRTARYDTTASFPEALSLLEHYSFPVVVKADGLAAGKGVIICQNRQEAEEALQRIIVRNEFGGASAAPPAVVIEEYLEGIEVSVLALVDESTILPFISAKDHKRIGDGDTGANTGGMGVIAPNPAFDAEAQEDFRAAIMEPTLRGIQAEGWMYRGVLFFGLMLTARGACLLEYNVRMGDPETQALLPLLESDLAQLFTKTAAGQLADCALHFSGRHACTVVAASGGYPGAYRKGVRIDGREDLNIPLFVAGARLEQGELVSSSGRVFSLTATGASLAAATKRCYANMDRLSFPGIYFRRDIGAGRQQEAP